MKYAPRAITFAAVGVCLATCGGGTLGGNPGSGNSGMIGPTVPTGAAGASGRGAPQGVGGAAGQGASGWEFGMAGTFGNPCPPTPTPICGSMCGNGQVDECPSTPAPACPISSWREPCDGGDFGGDSCRARGYGSGTLICNADCTLGGDDCAPCAPNDSLIASCAPGPAVPLTLASYSMAATDAEVALAMLQNDEYGAQSLLFKRLASDLSVLSTTTLDSIAEPALGENFIYGTAVAPLPSGGWIVAVCGSPYVYYRALDAAGRSRARFTVSSLGSGYPCPSGVPVLAATPNGGPLLIWQEEAGVMTSVIAADGLTATPPRLIHAGYTRWSENPTAAWVGNEFAVALPVEIDPVNSVGTLRLLRVAPDGTPVVVGDFLTNELDIGITMASGADARDVRLTYWGIPAGGDFNTDYGLRWWRREATGPVRSAAIDAPRYYSGPAPAVAFGDDTFVLVGHPAGEEFGIERVASDGRVVSPYRDIFRSPDPYGAAAMVRRGPEIVVSLQGPEQLYLLRLTP